MEALEKKMQQLENELAQTQTNLETATHNLEEKEKALQNVMSRLRREREEDRAKGRIAIQQY